MAQKEILGNFFGRTLVQSTSKLGGSRNVFVKLQGLKNELVFPTFGGQVKNPFKGAAKIYAGDLIEFRTNSKGVEPEIYILKSYEVVSVSGTTLNIVRDGYHHIPFPGDNIGLVADYDNVSTTIASPSSFTIPNTGDVVVTLHTKDNSQFKVGDVVSVVGAYIYDANGRNIPMRVQVTSANSFDDSDIKGKLLGLPASRTGYTADAVLSGTTVQLVSRAAVGAAVTAVAMGKVGDKSVWTLTLSAALTGVNAGDILTELTADNTPMVEVVNAVAPCDYDFCFAPAADPTSDTDDFENARYFMAPALGGIMYKHKMSPIPAYVEKFNEARINGWFEIHGVHV